MTIGKGFAHFRRRCIEDAFFVAYASDEENPFGCMLSQHADGNHSKSWFDGGTCAWCFQT